MDGSRPGSSVFCCLPEFAQIHVHWVRDHTEPSHPLSSPSPAFNLSQHPGLFQRSSYSPWGRKETDLTERRNNGNGRDNSLWDTQQQPPAARADPAFTLLPPTLFPWDHTFPVWQTRTVVLTFQLSVSHLSWCHRLFSPSHSSLPVQLLCRPFLPFFSPTTSLLLRTGSRISHGPLLLFCQQNHYYTINCCCCLVTRLCPTLCNPMDCSPPGSSVHGLLQARILEWEAIAFSRVSCPPGDWTHVSCTAEGFFITEPPGKPH